MELQTKNAAVEIKTNSTPGEFTAVISAIGNVDRQKDVVMSGAFEKAIANDPVPPVYWAHKHDLPPIGEGLDWREKNQKVEFDGRLFVGDSSYSHQYAEMVYAGMKSYGGRIPAIRQFSYTYGVPEGGSEIAEMDGKTVRLLHEIRPVAEVGPCFMGANPATYLAEPAKGVDAVADLVVARKEGGRRRISMKQLLADTLGLKDYGDIDGYEIRMLLDMLDSAVSFIQFSDEDDDTLRMQGIAVTLLGMLSDEFAEVTDLMAQGDAINAILNGDGPNVTVTVDVETASADPAVLGQAIKDAMKAKLGKKDDEAASEDAGASEADPAGESAGESETTEEQVAEVEAPEEEAAAEEAADESNGEAEEGKEGDSKSDNSMSSDDPSTVSNDEIARLAFVWPSH